MQGQTLDNTWKQTDTRPHYLITLEEYSNCICNFEGPRHTQTHWVSNFKWSHHVHWSHGRTSRVVETTRTWRKAQRQSVQDRMVLSLYLQRCFCEALQFFPVPPEQSTRSNCQFRVLDSGRMLTRIEIPQKELPWRRCGDHGMQQKISSP